MTGNGATVCLQTFHFENGQLTWLASAAQHTYHHEKERRDV